MKFHFTPYEIKYLSILDTERPVYLWPEDREAAEIFLQLSLP
jgi:hypothetical protein